MNVNAVTISVLVQDMDRSLRFYRDVLGLTLDAEEEDWAAFAEGVALMVSPDPVPDGVLSLNTVVLALDVDDVQAAYHELTSLGVPFLVGPAEVAGAVVATLRDPDGNLLQLVHRTPRRD